MTSPEVVAPDERGQSESGHSGTFDYDGCLRACVDGDKSALKALYVRESQQLLGVVSRIVRDRARAEDILHDAFVRIWQRASTFDASRGGGRGWVYTIARNLALDTIRSSGKQVSTEDRPEEVGDIDAAADPGNSQRWIEKVGSSHWGGNSERLQECLERLEPIPRACIFHAYVNGYSQSEIGDLIGAPVGTVKSWIKRSLVALRGCMG
ncbi:sigma-70 family RNA polymerase sigma factor [Marinobacter salinexigens]|uniref:Sigma-70 family RNA polymerase sigma factor n=1 Tax=Marinobacter salinexigens TaxID=2919747 RepID=A0A5B0VNX2_9GAMM|nr:sigma-70 family RNA polymerase sigma factor [Marinobacter salinexigens]